MLVLVYKLTHLTALGGLVLSLLCAAPAVADNHGARPVQVDVELVLAVDVSWSMTKRELEIQRRGYAEALASPAVAKAIAKGPIGRIALTYIEWGGEHWHRTIIDWTLIETRRDLQAFAGKLTIDVSKEWRKTSISGAIDYAVEKLRGNP